MNDDIPFIDRIMARIEAYAASFHVDGVVGDTESAVTKDHRNAIRRGIEEQMARRIAQPDEQLLKRFLDGAAGDGLVCGGVDAADLYCALFGEPTL